MLEFLNGTVDGFGEAVLVGLMGSVGAEVINTTAILQKDARSPYIKMPLYWLVRGAGVLIGAFVAAMIVGEAGRKLFILAHRCWLDSTIENERFSRN